MEEVARTPDYKGRPGGPYLDHLQLENAELTRAAVEGRAPDLSPEYLATTSSAGHLVTDVEGPAGYAVEEEGTIELDSEGHPVESSKVSEEPEEPPTLMDKVNAAMTADVNTEDDQNY